MWPGRNILTLFDKLAIAGTRHEEYLLEEYNNSRMKIAKHQ